MRFLVLTLLSLLAAGAAAASEPPVGFVCHYPWIDVGMAELPKSGASALITRAVFGMMNEDGSFDFSSIDRQIAYAEQHDLKLVLLLECNPVYAPPWLMTKVKAAGQAMKRVDGGDHTVPSITSRIFRAAREEFVRRTVEHVQEADRNGVITHYQAGAEWWFEMVARYHPEDVAGFCGWLEQRYGEVERLNRRWRASYTSFQEVPAPKVGLADWGRRDGLAPVIAVDVPPQDCSWSTRQGLAPKVTPGTTYTFSAWAKTDGAIGRGAHLAIAWLKADSNVPYHEDYSEPESGTTGWRRLSLTVKAPPDAARAWLLLKLRGYGGATFDNVEFREQGATQSLVLNSDLETGTDDPESWFFDNWLEGKGVSGEYLKVGGRGGTRAVRIVIPPPDPAARSYGNHDVAVRDWSDYWYETAAEYINSLARTVRQLDPTRPTATYLTFSFAFPAEWDYAQATAIRPDEVAIRGRDIGVMGMQICAAQGDPLRVTANLDIVRKYGKPMWAVDLLDFTSGVRIGYPAMEKVTHAAIQHGATGIFYYCWNGTTDYNFHPDMPLDDLNRMLSDARAAIRLVEGLTVRPRVALVEPILPASPSDAEGFKNDYRSFIGWYRILEGMHETFDVVTLRELERRSVDLASYDWVLLPDSAYLPRSVMRRLKGYVEKGGRLVASGRLAESDDVGVEVIPFARPRPTLALRDYGKDYAGALIRDTHAGNTPPLFIWRQDTAATRRAFQAARSRLRRFLREADVEPAATVSPDIPTLHCVLFAGPEARAVYLANMRAAPLRGGKVRVRFAEATKVQVFADAEPADCQWRAADGWIEVDLPEFRTSCVVKISANR